MKKFYSLLLVILLTSKLFSQTITIRKHLEYGLGFWIIQTEDEGYISSFTSSEGISLIRTDKYGEIIWKKNYDFDCLFKLKFIQTNNDNFILIASTKNNDVDNVLLLKFNGDGDSLWTKTFISSKREIPADIIATSDGGILIYAFVPDLQYTSQPHSQVLYKLNAANELQWKRNYEIYHSPSFQNQLSLKEWQEGYIFNSSRNILKVNYSGDSLFTIPVSSAYSLAIDDEENLFCSGKNQLIKIDSMGNKIFEKQIENGSYYHLLISDDGNIITSSRNALQKRTLEGDIIWWKSINSEKDFYYFIQTADKGFAFVDENGYLYKTDSAGVINSVQLIYPKANEYLVIGNDYRIYWQKFGSNSFKIEYSVNDGLTWQTIENQVIDTIQYYWLIPNSPTSVAKIKITDLNNPDIFDIGDQFTIGYNPSYDFIAANQVKMWLGNNGSGSFDPESEGCGFYWPGGENAAYNNTAVFQDGLIWGGLIDNKVYVNGNTHKIGLDPGKINDDGTAGTAIGIWKIKKDWQSLPAGPERDRYQFNYDNWPGELGAPYEDLNNDGQFTKGTDKPKFYGDEVLWFVANDLDTNTTHSTYGSDPIGLEVQCTTFGLNSSDDLADVVFKKYKLINKSSKVINNMYLGYWADCDLGDPQDDYVGCDSALSLGITYNSDNNDLIYYGENPPAIGYKLLQGPVINGELTDNARFDDRILSGKKNLPLTAFMMYCGSMPHLFDPFQGRYEGSLQFYNNLNGLYADDGTPFINPVTNGETDFLLSGNPVEGTGWYEGAGWPGGPFGSDRRFLMSSGNFNLSPADTQEIVFAIIMGRGSDNLNSVTELKRKAVAIQNYYDSHLPTNVDDNKFIPEKFVLYQNYPNPFNPVTTIKYSIPEKSTVQLKVYDVLGREVTTLVNEKQAAGNYHVTFDGSKLSSGVYFYQLKSGSFEATRKLVLIK